MLVPWRSNYLEITQKIVLNPETHNKSLRGATCKFLRFRNLSNIRKIARNHGIWPAPIRAVFNTYSLHTAVVITYCESPLWEIDFRKNPVWIPDSKDRIYVSSHIHTDERFILQFLHFNYLKILLESAFDRSEQWFFEKLYWSLWIIKTKNKAYT